MARVRKPCCKFCKRYGIKLYLKGRRCEGDKCAMDPRRQSKVRRRGRRPRISEYGLQLREKNKVKVFYGVLEAQFRRYFDAARQSRGVTGTVLLQLLERRLDNIVYRLNWSWSRRMARQAVKHGALLVNGRKIDRPGHTVKINDEITVKPGTTFAELAKVSSEERKATPVPSWLEPSQDTLRGKILRFPQRDEVSVPVEEQHIINLYSK